MVHSLKAWFTTKSKKHTCQQILTFKHHTQTYTVWIPGKMKNLEYNKNSNNKVNSQRTQDGRQMSEFKTM